MVNDNETVEQVALSDLPLAEQLRIIRGNYCAGSGEFDALDEAADVVECQQRKIAELNHKIASYERLLAMNTNIEIKAPIRRYGNIVVNLAYVNSADTRSGTVYMHGGLRWEFPPEVVQAWFADIADDKEAK